MRGPGLIRDLDFSSRGGRRCRRIRRFSRFVAGQTYFTQQPIPHRRHRGDETRLMRVISQQTAEQRNAARQRILRHRCVRPDGIQQLVLRDQPVRIAQQIQQDAKGLRLNRDRLATADETELPLLYFEFREAKDMTLLLRHEFITCLQEMIRTPS